MRLRGYVATVREAVSMTEDLAALALIELRGEIRSRLKYVLALAIATLLAVVTVLFAGVMMLVVAWDTPYRVATAIALVVVPLVLSVGIAWQVTHRWRNDQWLAATRSETRECYTWLKSKL